MLTLVKVWQHYGRIGRGEIERWLVIIGLHRLKKSTRNLQIILKKNRLINQHIEKRKMTIVLEKNEGLKGVRYQDLALASKEEDDLVLVAEVDDHVLVLDLEITEYDQDLDQIRGLEDIVIEIVQEAEIDIADDYFLFSSILKLQSERFILYFLRKN